MRTVTGEVLTTCTFSLKFVIIADIKLEKEQTSTQLHGRLSSGAGSGLVSQMLVGNYWSVIW